MMKATLYRTILRPRAARFLIVLAATAIAAFACAVSASAAEPWWHMDVVAAPTNLPPEKIEIVEGKEVHKLEEAQVELTATNIGDAFVSSGVVKLGDTLPAKLKVVRMEAKTARGTFPNPGEGAMVCLGVAKKAPSERAQEEKEWVEREE